MKFYKNMKEAMIDIETLGVSYGSVITEISIVNIQNKDEWYTFGISLPESLEKGFKIEQSTYDWRIKNKSLKFFTGSIKDALTYISSEITKDTIIWARSPVFDLKLLEAYYIAMEMEIPWNHSNTRCVRTIESLSGLKMEANSHDSYEDCLNQIDLVLKAKESFILDL